MLDFVSVAWVTRKEDCEVTGTKSALKRKSDTKANHQALLSQVASVLPEIDGKPSARFEIFVKASLLCVRSSQK